MAQKVKAMTLLLADNYNVNIVQVWGHPTHSIGRQALANLCD